MTTKENARLQAGAKRQCSAPDLTPIHRHRVQLSAQLACTFVASRDPLRLDVYWHGKGDPSRMGGLALDRYRRARDAFIERLAMQAGQTWAIGEPASGYLRAVGLVSCDVEGNA